MKILTRLLVPVLLLSLACSASPRDPRASLARSDVARSLMKAARTDLAALARHPFYRIEAYYDARDRTLTGHEEIWLTNGTGAPVYNLHLVTEAAALGPDQPEQNLAVTGLRVGGRPTEFIMGETVITVAMPGALAAGESTLVAFDFQIRLPDATTMGDGMGNAFSGLYGAGSYVTGIGGFPVLVPAGGEEDGPANGGGFTWAQDLVFVEMRLNLPEEWTVAGTGVVVDHKVDAGRSTFRLTGVTGGAPAVLAGPNLVELEREVGGVLVRALVPETRKRFAQAALDEAAAGLAIQQELFGTGLNREVEVLFAPLSGAHGLNLGGGLICVDFSLLSAEKDPAPATFDMPELAPLLEWDAARERQMTIYHELGHLWWSELVGPGVGGSGDLDEGLAEATALLTLERVAGAAAADRRRQAMALDYQVARLRGMADLPLSNDTYADGDQEFLIPYVKGGLFFDRLRDQVGEGPFLAALRKTLAEHRLGGMPPEGPVAVLLADPALKGKVEPFYRRWMLETRGDEDIGVLVVTDPGARAYLGLD